MKVILWRRSFGNRGYLVDGVVVRVQVIVGVYQGIRIRADGLEGASTTWQRRLQVDVVSGRRVRLQLFHCVVVLETKGSLFKFCDCCRWHDKS